MKALENLRQMSRQERAALVLRIGLGMVFLVGGLSKLSKLLDPGAQMAMVNAYIGPSGYVNEFFAQYIFGQGVSPWFFLTGLSSFEALSGLALILGLAVRPLTLIYGFLMWTFVMSLPVVTTPAIEVGVKTYTSPALLVMIRDIALSGLSFLLFNLGPGPLSLDGKLFSKPALRSISWDHLGVLLRLSLGAVMIVGGAFHGLDHIQSFTFPGWVLVALGLVLVSGIGSRYAGYLTIGVLGWYIATKLNIDNSILANLNSIKREIALVAAATVLGTLGGGNYFTLRLARKSA